MFLIIRLNGFIVIVINITPDKVHKIVQQVQNYHWNLILGDGSNVGQAINYKNNIITNNGGAGIIANANGTQNISENIVYNNNGNGIRSRGNGTYTIEKNIVVGNSAPGINGIYATHIIDNNIIANNAGGIAISQGGNYTVSDNQIVFNNNSTDGSVDWLTENYPSLL